MKTRWQIQLVAAALFGVLLAGAIEPPMYSIDELQRVPWLWRFAPMTPEKQKQLQVRVPTQDEVANRIVVDAQALLIRAAVLSLANQKPAGADIASLVTQAAADCRRIAAARPGAQYVQSHAVARADFTLAWLPDRTDNRYDMHSLALYALAVTAAARDVEENTINPDGLVPVTGPGFASDGDKPEYNYRPPEATYDARDMVRLNLRKLLSEGGVSKADIDNLITVFADQSLGGIKYLEEFRDAITRAGAQP